MHLVILEEVACEKQGKLLVREILGSANYHNSMQLAKTDKLVY